VTAQAVEASPSPSRPVLPAPAHHGGPTRATKTPILTNPPRPLTWLHRRRAPGLVEVRARKKTAGRTGAGSVDDGDREIDRISLFGVVCTGVGQEANGLHSRGSAAGRRRPGGVPKSAPPRPRAPRRLGGCVVGGRLGEQGPPQKRGGARHRAARRGAAGGASEKERADAARRLACCAQRPSATRAPGRPRPLAAPGAPPAAASGCAPAAPRARAARAGGRRWRRSCRRRLRGVRGGAGARVEAGTACFDRAGQPVGGGGGHRA
jgi:hypothetical protein